MYTNIYMVTLDNTAVSTARTLIQVNAGSNRGLEIIRAWVTFNSTTSTAIGVRLKRVTTAGTGTSATAKLVRPGDATFSGTATTDHTAEGTIGDGLVREFVNYLNGFIYLPVPEERIRVDASGRIALDFPSAPGASVNVNAGIIFGTL